MLLCWCIGFHAGCGAVGEPLPPLRNIPERTHDLGARQVEDQLILEWTAPSLNTEGTELKNLVRFEVYAQEIASPEDVPGLDVFERESRELLVLETATLPSYAPGGKIVRTVPVAGLQGKTLVLAVRGQSRNGREAALSNLFVIEVGTAPPKVAGVEAVVDPEGVVLTWTPAAGAESYEIRRAMAAEGPFQEIGRAAAVPFRDSAPQWNARQWYRIRGIAKTRTGEIKGLPSDSVEVVPKDLFPPAKPTGLRAIAGLTSVELVWDYNSEADIAGYRVLRGAEETSLEPLAPTLLSSANYTDADVQPGRTYSYSVLAIDANGNESERSDGVSVTLP